MFPLISRASPCETAFNPELSCNRWWMCPREIIAEGEAVVSLKAAEVQVLDHEGVERRVLEVAAKPGVAAATSEALLVEGVVMVTSEAPLVAGVVMAT